MIVYKDTTYCASPGCVNACGRKLTEKIKAEADAMGLHIAAGLFCGKDISDDRN